MSLCIRTIPNKFTPFVGTRKAIMRVDRQLPKHIQKSSAFLQEFLGAGTAANGKTRERVTSFRSMLEALKTSENVAACTDKAKKREESSNIIDGEGTSNATRRYCNQISTQNPLSTVYSSEERESVLRLEAEQNRKSQEPSGHGKASKEQLERAYQVLRTDLPAFFIKPTDYSIYHPMIQFENNIKGTVTRGIHEYIKQMSILRIIGHVKFAYVKFDVLKITAHPEDSSIKVRWRIRGLSGYKVLFFFWRFKVWNLKSTIDQLDCWHDGFSTFYVDGESGLIIKHVADKMMPDQENEISRKDKAGMAAKLALFLGLLIPREVFSSDTSHLNVKSIEPEGKTQIAEQQR